MVSLLMTYIEDDKDKKTVERLFNTYKKQMALLALSILHNESDSEDAVQNAFIKIISNNWKTVSKIDNDNDIRNYLLKATKNSCIDIMRKNNRQIVSADFITKSCKDTDIPIDSDFVETVCNKLDYEELVVIIESLDRKYSEVLYYHFVLEFSIIETAKILKQNISTTKMQLVRGKKQLIDLIDSKGVTDYGNE